MILLFLILKYTYSMYKNEAKIDSVAPIGVWEIFVNGEDIAKPNGDNTEFKIDAENVIWENFDENNVRTNKVVPGMEGTYKIKIDPKKTDTSIKYSISIDASSLKGTNLQITNIELNDGKEFDNIEVINDDDETIDNAIQFTNIKNSTDGRDKYKITRIKRLKDERKNIEDDMSTDIITISVKWNEPGETDDVNEFDKRDTNLASTVYAKGEKKRGEIPVVVNAIQYMGE